MSHFFLPFLLQVAEATVLHNEVQLQEALEERMSAEEQASGFFCRHCCDWQALCGILKRPLLLPA